MRGKIPTETPLHFLPAYPLPFSQLPVRGHPPERQYTSEGLGQQAGIEHASLIPAALTEGGRLHRTQEGLRSDSSPLDAVVTRTYRSGEVSRDFYAHVPAFSGHGYEYLLREYLLPHHARASDLDREGSKLEFPHKVPLSESQAKYLSNWHQPSQYNQRYQRLQPGYGLMAIPESPLLTAQDWQTSRRLEWQTGSSHHLVKLCGLSLTRI